MAGVRDDHRQGTLPEYGRGRRAPGVLGMLFVAVLAAIAVILILSRRPAYHPPVPAVGTAPAAMPPTAEPEPPLAIAPGVAPAAAAPDLSSGNQREITRVVSDGRAGLTACYQRALVRDPTLVHARLNVSLSIAPSGRVADVKFTGPAASRPVQPCLEEAISKWTFPSASAPYAAEFPLLLQGTQ